MALIDDIDFLGLRLKAVRDAEVRAESLLSDIRVRSARINEMLQYTYQLRKDLQASDELSSINDEDVFWECR